MRTVNCKHWRDCGKRSGGCCAIEAFTNPSFGTCERLCQQREPVDADKPAVLERAAHGAKGIAKALLGIDRPTQELVEYRTGICKDCPKAVLRLGVLQQCSACGCSTWAKIRNAGEKCPLGKW